MISPKEQAVVICNSIGAGVRALKASLKYITAIIGNVFTSPALNLGFASYQCNTKKQEC